MSTHSDLQTKQFYVLDGYTSTTNYLVKKAQDANLRRFIAVHSNGNETSDIINKKLVKRAVVNQINPTYYRMWIVNPMSAVSGSYVASDTTYSLYFYLENMYGFGLQDRWDLVSSYTTESNTSDTPAIVMAKLKEDLNGKLNPNYPNTYPETPLKGDFIVTILDGTMSVEDGKVLFGVTPTSSSASWVEGTSVEELTKNSGTNSGKKYVLKKHEGAYLVTYTFDDSPNDFSVNNNAIIVAENSNSNTFKKLDSLDYRMHDNPYVYDVTLSTYDSSTNEIWGNNKKRIAATNTANVYVSAASKVMDMELYFMRNRADLYDLNPNFNTSILNKTHVTNMSQAYYVIDIDYAFSDTQGYTYHSDKQLSIAVPTSTKSDATAILTAILAD